MSFQAKDWSIKKKIVVIAALCTISFSLLVYVLSYNVILKSFTSLENKELDVNLSRTQNIITTSISQLDLKLADWAVWDDSYQFIKDKNQAYIDSNLEDNAFSLIKVNAMFFLKNNGDIVYDKMVDLDKNTEIAPDELALYIKNNLNHFQFTKTNMTFSGIVPLAQGNLIVVARPILKIDGSGPVAGTIIFGKFIDATFIKNLSFQTGLDTSIYAYAATSTNDLILARENLSKDNKYFTYALSGNSLAGYFLLYDMNDNPILILRAVNTRDVYMQGKDTFNFFTILVIVLMILLWVISFIFIKLAIIDPVDTLNEDIYDITKSDDISKRVKIKNYDEIGNLAFSINTMLDSLYVAQEREKIVSDKLKEQFDEITKLNKLMVGRELKMVELKEEIERLKDTQRNK